MSPPHDPSSDDLRSEVVRRFGARPGAVRLIRSPYRVCPLGAHIDHQRGPVTALALDHCVRLAYAPADTPLVRLQSCDFAGEVSFAVDAAPARRGDDWGDYARGAARALQPYGLTRGIVGITAGKLHGGGVSSSAAVGVAFLLAFEAANGLEVTPEANIALDQAIENGYLGLRNGILDPAAVLLAKQNCLLRVDCRTSAYTLIPRAPALPGFAILLAFSGVRRALAATDYNRRVEECTAAARTLLSGVGLGDREPVLGNVPPAVFAAQADRLEGAPARRAAHFFGEVDRVGRGVAAWEAGDLAEFGALMTASGASSIRNYECGSPPLIDLYEGLIGATGVHGARFSGAGFRGCCVALVEPGFARDGAARLLAAYRARYPELAEQAAVVIAAPADGASFVEAGP